MPLIVGLLLALAAGLFARVVGLDRDRAFYPTVMIVIACLYALFAVIGSSAHALLIESLVGAVFVAGAVLGFRSSLWIVAVALADGVHLRVRMALVDRDELGAEAETDDRDADLALGHGAFSFSTTQEYPGTATAAMRSDVKELRFFTGPRHARGPERVE